MDKNESHVSHEHSVKELEMLDSVAHAHMHELGIEHEHTHIHAHENECGLSHENIDNRDHGKAHSHEELHTHTHAHGHSHSVEHRKAVMNRMARIIGHMQSVKTMVENDRDCSEVLIQLSAITSAINSVSRVIVKEHLSTCMIDAVKDGDYEAIDELTKAIDKFMK